jgi:hypothetical protein
MADEEFDTFVVVVILPDGYTASNREVTQAIEDQLNRYTVGARVSARGIGDEGWAMALMEANADLDNLEPDVPGAEVDLVVHPPDEDPPPA